SRRRHTRCYRDWSSDVCSSDLGLDVTHKALFKQEHADRLAAAGTAGKLVADLYGFYVQFHQSQYGWDGTPVHDAVAVAHVIDSRSEERRVGKEGGCGGWEERSD